MPVSEVSNNQSMLDSIVSQYKKAGKKEEEAVFGQATGKPEKTDNNKPAEDVRVSISREGARKSRQETGDTERPAPARRTEENRGVENRREAQVDRETRAASENNSRPEKGVGKTLSRMV